MGRLAMVLALAACADPAYELHWHVPAAFGSDVRVDKERLILASPADACTPLSNAHKLAGNVALVTRGGCNFTEKVLQAQRCGAKAVIVGDTSNDADCPCAKAVIVGDTSNEADWAVIMSGSAAETAPITIPAVFVSAPTAALLRDLLREEAHLARRAALRRAPAAAAAAAHTVLDHVAGAAVLVAGAPVFAITWALPPPPLPFLMRSGWGGCARRRDAAPAARTKIEAALDAVAGRIPCALSSTFGACFELAVGARGVVDAASDALRDPAESLNAAGAHVRHAIVDGLTTLLPATPDPADAAAAKRAAAAAAPRPTAGALLRDAAASIRAAAAHARRAVACPLATVLPAETDPEVAAAAPRPTAGALLRDAAASIRAAAAHARRAVARPLAAVLPAKTDPEVAAAAAARRAAGAAGAPPPAAAAAARFAAAAARAALPHVSVSIDARGAVLPAAARDSGGAFVFRGGGALSPLGAAVLYAIASLALLAATSAGAAARDCAVGRLATRRFSSAAAAAAAAAGGGEGVAGEGEGEGEGQGGGLVGDLGCCSICLDDYRDGDDVTALPCRHQFHKDCVQPWLVRGGLCPLCKSDALGERPPRGAHSRRPSWAPAAAAAALGGAVPSPFELGDAFAAHGFSALLCSVLIVLLLTCATQG
ncbi:hypothetical protein JKP88DRAFT_348409 [Tribonema minus]|uniref:RING-type E3 ubiquitin transferase n=1 Tax=Tribonema minus TaxID=303371 RepID=A0A836CGU0_9STRA|nr:hypothetical protein JKP88DRAFT_348409 [Tribonema minus]